MVAKRNPIRRYAEGGKADPASTSSKANDPDDPSTWTYRTPPFKPYQEAPSAFGSMTSGGASAAGDVIGKARGGKVKKVVKRARR